MAAVNHRNIVVLRDQPAVIPRPSAEPLWSSDRTYEKTMERERQRSRERSRLRRTTSRGSSVRKKLWFSRSSSSVRRLKISGPTDFRHLQSESFQLYPAATRPRPRSFRPIELSIYRPQNRLSPILPYIEFGVTPPRRAYTANSSQWDASSSSTLAHDRSYSTMSFHIPRKHTRQESSISDASLSPPRIPPKSRARASRALTAHRIVERIASAIIEKERLQAEIDSVIERQSIYVDSRPSTAYDMRGEPNPRPPSIPSIPLTPAGLEPMPSIPALPAAAPSFAERLSIDDHPRTVTTSPSSPSSPPHMMTVQEKTLSLAAAAAAHSRPHTPPSASSPTSSLDRPLAPPLPLVLRPPLRKKKSFSRVSSWLFHPDEQPHITPNGTVSSPALLSNTTNTPRPIKQSDGFYQCVAPPEGLPRTSMETSSSVYTWGTGEEEDEEDGESKTVPTTEAWSPEQTPKGGSRHTSPVVGAPAGGFEKEVGVGAVGGGYRPVSVGVAF